MSYLMLEMISSLFMLQECKSVYVVQSSVIQLKTHILPLWECVPQPFFEIGIWFNYHNIVTSYVNFIYASQVLVASRVLLVA